MIDEVVNSRGNWEAHARACRRALEVLSESEHGETWANVQALYAQALSYLTEGDLPKNVQEARVAGTRAIRYYQRRGLSEQLARVRGVMADTEYTFAQRYFERAGPDRAGDVEAAIGHLEIALRGYPKTQKLTYWADTQDRLGECYQIRGTGSREDNLEKAIEYHRAKLTVRTPASSQREWVESMIRLAIAYDYRLAGDGAKNTELALLTFQEALANGADSEQAVRINHGLGVIYNHRVRGDRAANIESAIQHLTTALQGMSREREPRDWARTHQASAPRTTIALSATGPTISTGRSAISRRPWGCSAASARPTTGR